MINIEKYQYPTPQQEYKVLVRCLTYNQSKYIEDALNGFAIQQTSFPFVCLVMDDASTDGEQEVIKGWMKRECDMSRAELIDIPMSIVIIVPHKTNTSCTFAFYLLKENLYGTGKKDYYLTPWREKCEYEALCEGDDYWIEPLKLQKQVDFLNENPNYGLVYTKAKVYEQKNKVFNDNIIGRDAKTFDDLIKMNCVGTLTTCYRKNLYEQYKTKIEINPNWKMGDYPLWLFISLNSKIKFIDEYTAVYRKQEQSASNHKDIKNQLTFLESSSDICSYFLSYANRWDLKKVYNEKYCNIIMANYISYNMPIKFSSIKKYWIWAPRYILKYILSQFAITRKILRRNTNE